MTNFASTTVIAGKPPPPATSGAVTAKGLGKRFGRTWALAHVDLEVPRGDSVLLVGANGSGKTTLLRLLCGLLRPTTGRLEVFGLGPHLRSFEVRPRVTLVSHRTYLYEQLSALEHVRLWQGLAVPRPRTGDQGADDLVDASELLEDVGLDHRALDPVSNFSAGMRKRLSLLRTRIEDPDLILLDEPFSALDPSGQEMVTRWLAQLADAGKTLIVASHALERARPLCTRAVVLRAGQVVWRGPSSEVKAGLLEAVAPADTP